MGRKKVVVDTSNSDVLNDFLTVMGVPPDRRARAIAAAFGPGKGGMTPKKFTDWLNPSRGERLNLLRSDDEDPWQVSYSPSYWVTSDEFVGSCTQNKLGLYVVTLLDGQEFKHKHRSEALRMALPAHKVRVALLTEKQAKIESNCVNA